MSRLTSGQRTLLPRLRGESGRQRFGLAGRDESEELSPALVITGLVAVGLFAWACYKFGPELIRYIKIRNM